MVTSDNRWKRALAPTVVAVALLFSVLAVAEYRSWAGVQARLTKTIESAGTAARSPGAAADIWREPDPAGAELRAARLVLADELDRAWQTRPQGVDASQSQGVRAARLAEIEKTARRNLASRPSSWQAAMILGAARYLTSARGGRRGTESQAAGWQAPLELARELGPGRPEPTRFLAAAALSQWQRLGAAGRDRATELIRQALEDPVTLELLLEPWMRRAPSEAVALGAIPDRPQAWDRLEDLYARTEDWERFAATRPRREDAQRRELERRLAGANERLAGGDTRGGRSLLLAVLDDTAPGRRHVPILERAMELLPAGPVGEWRSRRLRAWLDWARERCLLDECALSASTVERIAGVAGLAELHDRAVVALMAGRIDRARRLATQGGSTLLPEWGPYLLLQADLHRRAGEIERARATLRRVHASWHGTLAYRNAVDALQEPAPTKGSESTLAAEWSGEQWRRNGDTYRLELMSARTCDGLRVEASTTGRGSAVELRWDGESLDWFAVQPATRRRLELPVEPGAHVLELVTIAGERTVPDRVALRDCSA